MALGPGKYDKECDMVHASTGGSVLVIVVGGDRGQGFSCKADADTLLFLPEMLEGIAAQLREDRLKMLQDPEEFVAKAGE